MVAKDRRMGRLAVRGLNRNLDVVGVCDCGETIAVNADEWLSGKRYQCGSCDDWEMATPIQQIIGCKDTYQALINRARGAKDRCENSNSPAYPDFGGRGIQFLFRDFEHYALRM